MQIAAVFELDQVLKFAVCIVFLVEDDVDVGGEHAFGLGIVALGVWVFFEVVVQLAVGLSLGNVLMAVSLFDTH